MALTPEEQTQLHMKAEPHSAVQARLDAYGSPSRWRQRSASDRAGERSADDWWRNVVAPETMLIRAALQKLWWPMMLIPASILILAVAVLIS